MFFVEKVIKTYSHWLSPFLST